MLAEFVRKFKLSYMVFNFFKKKELEYNMAHFKKFGINKKYYSSLSSEDFKAIDSPLNIHDAKDSATELPNQAAFQALDPATQESLLTWSRDGYVILKNFFQPEEAEAFNQEIEALIQNNTANWRYNNRILFAIHRSKLLHGAGAHPKLMTILKLLLGKEVDLFQSINFIKGSQQRTHSDSIHMTTFPYGNMIAAWVALEDITIDNGPLHYYPGSHKLPYVMNKDYDNVGTKHKIGDKQYSVYEDKIESIIQERQLKKEVFLAKKGDVLIWHANLLHGGNAVNDSNSTRKSMVFHYYSQDAICFHEISQRPTLKK